MLVLLTTHIQPLSLRENSFLPHPSCHGCVCLISSVSLPSKKSLPWELFPLSSTLRKDHPEHVSFLCFIFWNETWNTLAPSGRCVGSLMAVFIPKPSSQHHSHQAPLCSLCEAVTGIIYSKAPSAGSVPQLASFSVHVFTLLFQRNENAP